MSETRILQVGRFAILAVMPIFSSDREPSEPGSGSVLQTPDVEARLLISVVVPFRNAEQYLDDCLESLAAQTLPSSEYETLLIDNGSDDASASIVRRYPGVRLLQEERPGAYCARNRGLEAAQGEILAFTDPDCRVDADWLEQILRALEEPSIGIVLGDRLPPTTDRLVELLMAYDSQKVDFLSRHGCGFQVFGHTNNMAVRRSLMAKIGPFPEILRGGDTVLVRRALDAFGPEIVTYRSRVRVTHLEIDRLSVYYDKQRAYGESSLQVNRLVEFRSLTLTERWAVFRATVSREGLSAFEALTLFGLLIAGVFRYEWSRLQARTPP